MTHLSPSSPPLPDDRARAPRARVLSWRPIAGNDYLIGKASIAFRNGVVVNEVPVYRRADGTLSASAPDVPLVDDDGLQLRDATGKHRYRKLLQFETSDAARRWNDVVVEALLEDGVTGSAAADGGAV